MGVRAFLQMYIFCRISSEKFLLFLLEEIHCRISSLLNIYFVCSFSFDQFYLGRHLLWEFCVVKNLHFSCKLYFCEVIYCKSLAL